jgi:GT2 family glycosyltransferase
VAAVPGWRAEILDRLADLKNQLLFAAAMSAGKVAQAMKALLPAKPAEPPSGSFPPGITVVIPSRNGKHLLETALPGVERELEAIPSEVIIVDNGSNDGTSASFPRAILEVSAEPLSFARAVNLGIRRARYSHICLLNNDMIVESGFFQALRDAFDRVPDLFCATAHIFFPPGVRREETGKAVMARDSPTDFPVRCDLPIPGEDGSYVLYGSGGCSLYDARMLHALGDVAEIYTPVYVEDLDLGFRAWARGWPTVFVREARVEHRHRATASRYYSEEQLSAILEVNYLRFLAGAVGSPALFDRLWREAIERLRLLSATAALRFACRAPLLTPRPIAAALPEEEFLALTKGDVAIFPGRARWGNPVLIRSVNELETPLDELLETYVEVVLVKAAENSLTFQAAQHQTARKWSGQRPSSANARLVSS